jgi:hypothetical protein
VWSGDDAGNVCVWDSQTGTCIKRYLISYIHIDGVAGLVTVCSMALFLGVCSHAPCHSSSMLTYPHVSSRVLTYADVCRRMLTYADVC